MTDTYFIFHSLQSDIYSDFETITCVVPSGSVLRPRYVYFIQMIASSVYSY